MLNKYLTSIIPLIGRLVMLILASVLLGVQPAAAQQCTPPPGTTPVTAPSTRADAVTNMATLEDFTVAVRDLAVQQPEQALYISCLARQDDGIWRDGDETYIVILTLDGRVQFHSKDMSLSGRQLNPQIYGAILVALGVSTDVLANLASPDPATQNVAFGSLIGTLSAQPDAAFNDPNTPGASGHAAAYQWVELQSALVLLAGFDLNESHLVPIEQENIDYGNPTVTAADVIDRRTLKAFVTNAGNYMLSLYEGGDPRAASLARIALRDENGPWRQGNVYLYVLDLNTNTITFHAQNPDRFENRPLTPTVRDAVTGEFILTQVIDAARGDPEGGFVEYFFDDPNDTTDSAEVPKLGYARVFTGEVQRPGAQAAPISIIVGSGFYPSSHSASTVQSTRVVENLLPQVMRATTSNTLDAISNRLRQAHSGDPSAADVNIGGSSSLSNLMLTTARELDGGTLDTQRLLANSSFTLPIDGMGAGKPLGGTTFWGRGDYVSFSGSRAGALDYDGNVMSAHLGMDAKLGAELLAGVAVGLARGKVDYTDYGLLTGEMSTNLTSIHPYIGWQSPEGLSLWAAVGHGWGDVEINEASLPTQRSDLSQQMAAIGVSGPLLSRGQMFAGGTTNIRLKGEAAFTRTKMDGSATMAGADLDSSRIRLVVEGSNVRKLNFGATLTPSLELGTRYDGGDGETGSGIEAGGGLTYYNRSQGLTMEGRVRTLLHHNSNYEEWGLSGLVKFDPGELGRGLSLSIRPKWGQAASGVQQLWDNGLTVGVADSSNTAQVDTRVAYGIAANTWAGKGMLTPYTDLLLLQGGSHRLSFGSSLDIGSSIQMGLEGVFNRSTWGEVTQSIQLRTDMRF